MRCAARWSQFQKLLMILTVMFASIATVQSAFAIRVVSYNVLNYNGGREASLRTVFNGLQADVIILQEVNSLTAAVEILSDVLNHPSGPQGYAIATFTDEGSQNNALIYRTAVFSYAGISAHTDVPTQPRDTDRWLLTVDGFPGLSWYFYGGHLKAGSTTSDEDDREVAAELIRNNIEQLPAGSFVMFAGDFNLKRSTEPAYEELIGVQAVNTGRLFDPINTPGNWTNNASFASIHTQSPHANNPGAPAGAASGGLDDRFDFQLVTANLLNSSGLNYVAGTYKAYGNDGLHFNDDINDSPTIPEGAAMADALHSSSDHLPVVADYQVPALLDALSSLNFGNVIEGGTLNANFSIGNGVDLSTFGFAENLSYSLQSPADVSTPGGSFSAVAGSAGNSHNIGFTPAGLGAQFSSFTINSNAHGQPQSVVSVSANVLAHANSSLSATQEIQAGTVDFGTHADGDFNFELVNLHNLGYNAQQAFLELTSMQIIGGAASRFSIAGGFQTTLIGSVPFSLPIQFDSAGATGLQQATMVLNFADDPSVAGALIRPSIVLTLTANVSSAGCPTEFIRGEMNGDSSIDVGDSVYLLAYLFDGGSAPLPILDAGDVNNDGAIDVADVIYLLAYSFGGGAAPDAPFPTLGCP